jgi:hypothetical protein
VFLFANHFCSALRTGLVNATLACQVWFFVPTTWADAVASWARSWFVTLTLTLSTALPMTTFAALATKVSRYHVQFSLLM